MKTLIINTQLKTSLTKIKLFILLNFFLISEFGLFF